jgi:solute carrier family 25 (mitochondrial phosphate transporter), member 3
VLYKNFDTLNPIDLSTYTRQASNMIYTRLISLTNFVVASSALGFQVFVLYPWHKQLDESFEELKKEHVRVLDAVRDVAKEIDPDSRKGIRNTILGRLGMSTSTNA